VVSLLAAEAEVAGSWGADISSPVVCIFLTPLSWRSWCAKACPSRPSAIHCR